MRLTAIEPEFVHFILPELQPGKLYVSMVYATTTHLCACGCGNKVVLPLSPADWQLHFDGDSISLTPSIGNWEFPCRSHYWIKANNIRWAAPWGEAQIAAGRRRDVDSIHTYFTNRQTDGNTGETQHQPSRERLGTIWRKLKRLNRH